MEVLFLMLLFLYIFAIISVNYFKGYLYNCTTEGLDKYYQQLNPIIEKMNTKWDCLNAGAEWKNRYLNFDNVPEAMSTLFVMSNSVQWSSIMYHSSSAQGIDLVSREGQINSVITAIFFVFIVVLGNFFVMNLYVGVIISKYNREKDLNNKDIHLTEAQKKWMKNRMNIIQSRPIFRMKLPTTDWR
jgi:sensor histidine kinase YesM